MIFCALASVSISFVGEVDRIGVEDANPLDAVDLVQLAEQLGQADVAVEVEAVVGRVLGDEDQLAHAVGGQLARLAEHFLDRLGDVLAAHAGDGAEGAESVAALGDLQIGVVPRRDAQAGGVFQGADRGGAEQAALLGLHLLAQRARSLTTWAISSRPKTPTM